LAGEQRIKVPLPSGGFAEGLELQVEESTERWSDITLSDGAKIRVKTTVVSAVRVPDQYDPQGNPLYFVNTAPLVTIISVPDELKKKAQ
jgi:hypothetical protein